MVYAKKVYIPNHFDSEMVSIADKMAMKASSNGDIFAGDYILFDDIEHGEINMKVLNGSLVEIESARCGVSVDEYVMCIMRSQNVCIYQ